MANTVRLSINVPQEEHMYLKLAATKLGLSMKEFIIKTMNKEIDELEDKWLSEEASVILKEIDEGKRKTISQEEFDRRMKNV
jgi:predicted DNA-binding protein